VPSLPLDAENELARRDSAPLLFYHHFIPSLDCAPLKPVGKLLDGADEIAKIILAKRI
jgi:hypothetical protein